MALINSIRKRTGLVVGTVAIGLGLFVVGDNLLNPNSILFGGGNDNILGKIAGEEINYEDFKGREDLYTQNFSAQNQKPPSAQEVISIREQVWNYYIQQFAFGKEYKKLGIAVSDAEIRDMFQGKNIHPYVEQNFRNPESGEFDVTIVQQQLKQLQENGQTGRLQLFEQSVAEDRQRTKYSSLMELTNYVTKAEAEQAYQQENSSVNIKFVHIPFTAVNDSIVNVSDEQLTAYLNSNEKKYERENSRSMDYVSFPIEPTAEDTAYFKAELDKISSEFLSTDNDSAFASYHSDGNTPYKVYSLSDLPAVFKSNDSLLQAGTLYGPTVEGGSYKLYKVISTTAEAEPTARASHILIKPASQDEAGKALAKADAQRILNQIKGGADFAEMARKHGTDGTASKGGDLGYFGKGRMVAEFEEAVFSATKTGLIPNLVETQFGYHIIEVTEIPDATGIAIACIEKEIIPGEQTRESLYQKANRFASSASNLDEFNELVEQDSLEVKNAKQIDQNARRINNLNEAREIVRWLYNEADKGDVSGVFEVNYKYIVAVMTNEHKKGLANLEDVRVEVDRKVKNEEKAKYIIEKIKDPNAELESIKELFGEQAKVLEQSDVKLSTSSLNSIGFSPISVGAAFALKKGERSKPIIDENGVVIMEVVDRADAPEIADYESYKEKLQSKNGGRVSYNIGEAIKEYSNIEDERYKFF